MRRRNMQKMIDEYKHKFWGKKNHGRGTFYASDFWQIMEIGEREGGGVSDYIDNAMMAGFMCGYKLGRRDQKEGRR